MQRYLQPSITIGSHIIEQVDTCKYLGTTLNKKLNFGDNTSAIFSKAEETFCRETASQAQGQAVNNPAGLQNICRKPFTLSPAIDIWSPLYREYPVLLLKPLAD